MTLIGLFELALDGTQTRHRQFMMENGSIIEVFDEIEDLLKKYSVKADVRVSLATTSFL